MDILFTLIPLSIILLFAILVALYWAVHSGQFEDLDVEAERILLDDDMAADMTAAAGQKAPPTAVDSPSAPRPDSPAGAPRDSTSGPG